MSFEPIEHAKIATLTTGTITTTTTICLFLSFRQQPQNCACVNFVAYPFSFLNMSQFRAKKLDLGCYINTRILRDHTKRKVFEQFEPQR